MLLDHFNSFADFQSVDLLLDFPVAKPAPRPTRRARPRSGGFLPDTLVDTNRGFIQMRDVKPGDSIYTFDGGCQDVKTIKHGVPRLTTLVHIPAGALGNDVALQLPSDQMVALELDAAERLFDVPLVMTRLISLVGYKGITVGLPQRMARIHLSFEEEELIWTESGMLLQANNDSLDSAYRKLSLAETRQILASEDGRALAMTGMAPAPLPAQLDDFLAPLAA
jgi:Hint domain